MIHEKFCDSEEEVVREKNLRIEQRQKVLKKKRERVLKTEGKEREIEESALSESSVLVDERENRKKRSERDILVNKLHRKSFPPCLELMS